MRVIMMPAKEFLRNSMLFIGFVPVTMTVVMRMLAGTVGARFRFEGQFRFLNVYLKSFKHVFEDRVVFKNQARFTELDLRMPVAKMVCGTSQLQGRFGCYSQDFLFCRPNLDQCSVFCFEQVAIM